MKNVIGSQIPLEVELLEKERAVVKVLHASIQHSTIECVNRKSTILRLRQTGPHEPFGRR